MRGRCGRSGQPRGGVAGGGLWRQEAECSEPRSSAGDGPEGRGGWTLNEIQCGWEAAAKWKEARRPPGPGPRGWRLCPEDKGRVLLQL